MKRPVVLSAIVALALFVLTGVGCGGGGSSSSSDTSQSSTSSNASSSETTAGKGQSEEEQTAVIAEFRVPGGQKQESNQILSGGREGSAEEREAASLVLEENFDARANRDWASQCATLAKKMVELVELGSGVEARLSCPKRLADIGEQASQANPKALVNNMDGPVAVLRKINKTQAFAFFHGKDGNNYLIPLEEDSSGEWKVASLAPEKIQGS